MEQLIKLRKQLDGFAQVTSRLKSIKTFEVSASSIDVNDQTKTSFEVSGHTVYKNSDSIIRAAHNLTLAKAWTGKLMGTFGVETPYKNDGKREGPKDIEPAAEKVDAEEWEKKANWSQYNHVQKIDYLREKIKGFISTVEGLPTAPSNRESAICRTQIWIHLHEASINFGLELQRIYEEEPH